MNTNTNKLLIGILLVLVFGAGFLVGTMTSGGEALKGVMGTKDAVSETPTGEQAPSGEATTITTSSLTEGQKKMLNALGIDAESINVTPAMIACAESSLGAERVEAIKNGATPSILEGGKLVGCYK